MAHISWVFSACSFYGWKKKAREGKPKIHIKDYKVHFQLITAQFLWVEEAVAFEDLRK